MSIVSESEPSRPTISHVPATSTPSTSKLLHPSELDDSELAIDRALAEEIWEAENGVHDSGFGDMLASVSEARPAAASERKATRKSTNHKAAALRTFETACTEDPSLMKDWRRGRFDVKVKPKEKHLTVWDVKTT